MAAVNLSLASAGRAEQLAELTRELLNDLQRDRTISAAPAAAALQPGERAADIGLLGQMVLTFLGAGAATALISCLKAYVERDRTLKISIARPDGMKLEFEGKHFDAQRIQETVQALERLVGS